ncbi:MAG: DUF4301 family protein [Deltaproteobacteria bacterium]|nr:DUF4301 family protein [Candidatus Anaeroferrophillacea bacterium]
MSAEELFSAADLEQIAAHGLELTEVQRQLDLFAAAPPPAELVRPCTVGDGIVKLDEPDLVRLAERYENAAACGRAMKFVPASGAATRMFKSLLATRGRFAGPDAPRLTAEACRRDDACADVVRFFTHLDEFAFVDDLRNSLVAAGTDLEHCRRDGFWDIVLEHVLTGVGLDLASRPKGLIPFHRCGDRIRTPLAEHLAEAAGYVRDREGRAALHLTVSPEHRLGFADALAAATAEIGAAFETTFTVDFSEQHRSTDTIAVDLDNRPFRDEAGRLVFRPGGHGALLINLAKLHGDLVFIKNIDNVVPDRLKAETCRWKKALGGLLVEIQDEVFPLLRQLEEQPDDAAVVARAADCGWRYGCIELPAALAGSGTVARAAFWFERLHRPVRVCGMVKNDGEPGGGPFWVRDGQGRVTPQIVESAQVDHDVDLQECAWLAATHFNPVDLVCGLRDFRGRPFDLSRFVDPATAFISRKSAGGRDLKALEHPGLWNGAMARWITLFVEVPLPTFNPVKTVFDLLRPEHQPATL